MTYIKRLEVAGSIRRLYNHENKLHWWWSPEGLKRLSLWAVGWRWLAVGSIIGSGEGLVVGLKEAYDGFEVDTAGCGIREAS